MALSKRIRYEVLKRDNHTCRYCHATDSPLTVDHVTPVALGGSDAPENLVAACRDCNYGKSSTAPDAETVAQVGADDIRWADAVKRAADAMLIEQQVTTKRHEWFLSEWREWDPDYAHLPDGWGKSIDYWVGAGLPPAVLVNCLSIALANRAVRHENVFAYMGGIARKRIEELHEIAKALLERGDDE